MRPDCSPRPIGIRNAPGKSPNLFDRNIKIKSQNLRLCCPSQDPQVFRLIMSYLTLADMAILAKSSPRLEKLVQSYVNNGGNIILNNHVLCKYPIQTNRSFYLSFKNASSMTLNGIAECDIAGIMSHFHHIQRLNLTHMQILEDINAFPQRLTHLSLFKVRFEADLLKALYAKVKDTLTSLSYDRIETAWVFMEWHDFKEWCPNLKSIVYKGGSTNMRLEGHLKTAGQCPFQEGFMMTIPTSLESLYVDTEWPQLNLKNTRIISLTLRQLPADVPTTLERLNILDAQHSDKKMVVEKWDIKETNVHYYNDPDPPQQPNLILSLLNADCLLKVAEYLPVEDKLVFCKTHSKISELLTRHSFIVMYGPDNFREHMETWIKASPFIKKLAIYNPGPDLLVLLPYCSGLDVMDFEKQEVPISFLAPLRIQLKQGPLLLGNLSELSADGNIGLYSLLMLLRRNKDTLRVFRFYHFVFEDWDHYQSIWQLIAEMEHINHIGLAGNDFSWESLDEYSDYVKKCKVKPYVKRILSLVGRKLRALTVDLPDYCLDLLNETNLPHLEELGHDRCDFITGAYFEAFRGLKKLRKINLKTDEQHEVDIIDSDLLRVIKSLPDLVFLRMCVPFNFSIKFTLDLEEYLRREGRFLFVDMELF